MLALTKKILDAYRNNEFITAIIYGKYGWGKTSYESKVLSEVYCFPNGTINHRLSMYKEYMKFHPINVVNYWFSRDIRGRAFAWDDAGYWLYALDWTDPVLKAISRYLTNLARTDWGCVMMTTPDPRWIIKKVRDMPSMITIRIAKVFADNDPSHVLREDGSKLIRRDGTIFLRRHIRLATAYEGWVSPSMQRSGVNKLFQDVFDVMMPNHVYTWYKPYRNKFSKLAKKSMKEHIRRTILSAIEKGKLSRWAIEGDKLG